jgi:hypothetical protein
MLHVVLIEGFEAALFGRIDRRKLHAHLAGILGAGLRRLPQPSRQRQQHPQKGLRMRAIALDVHLVVVRVVCDPVGRQREGSSPHDHGYEEESRVDAKHKEESGVLDGLEHEAFLVFPDDQPHSAGLRRAAWIRLV